MRSTARVCGVSLNTVARYLDLAGQACAEHHDQHVREIKGKRDFQCDELWSFVYAKDKSLDWAVPWDDAGTVWTWIALDAQSKLIASYLFSLNRDARSATALFRDLDMRLERRPRVTADSLKGYKIAASRVWGRKADLSQIRKGEETDHNTSYVERCNLTFRMCNRRYARKTNAFSKKSERHMASVHLLLTYYNFCRIHQTLKITPAMEAGLCSDLRDYNWLADLVESVALKPSKPGPAIGTKYRPRASKVDG